MANKLGWVFPGRSRCYGGVCQLPGTAQMADYYTASVSCGDVGERLIMGQIVTVP